MKPSPFNAVVANVLALSAVLVSPMLVVPSPASARTADCCHAPSRLIAVNYEPTMQHQSAWHTNMRDRTGTLVGLSPVAAKIAFNNGAKTVFSISHDAYERLRPYVGDDISFDVRHNVLQPNNE